MYLPESIGWALEHERVSTVKIYCGDNIKEEVAKFFEERLADEWAKACKKVEETYGEPEDEEVPISVSVADFGVCVSIETVEIRYCYGDYCDLQYGGDALDWALDLSEAQKEKIVKAGVKNVKDNFTKQIMCDKTIAVYRELVEQK